MKPDSKNLNRRSFLKDTALISGSLLLGGLAYRAVHNHNGRNYKPERAKAYLDSIEPSLTPQSLPNIVIILCDDLGYGDLESPILDTSNIHRMASTGISMSSFYATASVCSPSRAGLLTGRYPVRTLTTTPYLSTYDAMNTVMDILGRYSYGVTGIPEDEVLLSEVLQRRGYATGLVGKWHLGGTTGHLPNERGFDSFYGALWSNDDQPYAIYQDQRIVIPAPADQNILTRDFTRAALDFINKNKDKPFFLYLAQAMPHVPIHASDEFRGTSAGGLYGDAVAEINWSVGQVFDSLQTNGLSENTLVIFTSDNGPWWEGNPGYARGRKLLCFEGGFRVPFIAAWPGVIPAGINSAEVCVNFDLFPTFLKMAGVTLPQDRIIDGRDILEVLQGTSVSPHENYFYYDTRSLVAVRHNQYKYHRNFRTDNAAFWPLSQGPFLFDLTQDPNESYSLIDSLPDLAIELAKTMTAFESEIERNLRGWL